MARLNDMVQFHSIKPSKYIGKQTNKHSWGSHHDIICFLCVMYLASWDNQDLSVTHQRCASTEWLVLSWTFQHRRFLIDLSQVEHSISVHPFLNWKNCGTQLSFVIQMSELNKLSRDFQKFSLSSSTTHKFPSLSLSGTYLRYVFMLQMTGTDWSCTGEEPP